MKIEPIEHMEEAVLRAGSRVHRFFRRHVPLAIGSIVVLSVLLAFNATCAGPKMQTLPLPAAGMSPTATPLVS